MLYACFMLRVPGEGMSRRRVDGGRLLSLARGKQFPKPQYIKIGAMDNASASVDSKLESNVVNNDTYS